MTIQYTAGPERKKLAAAIAEAIGTKAVYAGMPSASYIADIYTITRAGALTGPDDRDLIVALAKQGFQAVEATYDEEPAQPDRLTIEVPINEDWCPAKLNNLKKLIASRESLLKKVLGADALPIVQDGDALKFSWFPIDDNAMVYGQLACALVRTAAEATRITAREQQDCASEKFRMRTLLLKLNFIGPEHRQARKILTQGLSGNGSYAKADPQ